MPEPDLTKKSEEIWTDEAKLSYAGYYFLVGEYLALENNTNDAERMFAQANDLDPNEFIAVKLVNTKINAGKLEETLAELRKLILQFPESAQLHFLYGTLLSKFAYYDKAVQHLNDAIKLDSMEERAYLQLISIHRKNGENTKAINVAMSLTQAMPRSTAGWLTLARLLVEEKRTLEALKPAEYSYKLNRTNTEAILLFAHVLEKNGKSVEAIKLYDELFTQDPSLEELLSKTIALHKAFGELDQVLERLETMSNFVERRSVGIEVQKAFVLWELNRNQEALSVLMNLHESQPESMQIQYLTALGHEKMNDFANAQALYEGISEDSRFYLPANFQSLKIFQAQNRMGAAYEIVHKLAKSRYVISEVFVLGANLYAKEKKYDEAIAILNEGFKKFPDNLQLLFLVGVYQERAGKFDDCIATMKEVIRLDTNHSSALNYLGYMWAERGMKLDIAEKLIRRALSLKPEDGFYLDSLGWVFYQRKEYEKALEFLIKAANIEPDEGVIIEHVGDAHLKLHRVDDARKSFEEALTKDSMEEEDKERVRNKLKALEPSKTQET